MNKWQKAVLGIALVILNLFVLGAVFLCGWSWFVVPLGFPEITLSQSIGLCTLATLPGTTFATRIGISTKDDVSSQTVLIISIFVMQIALAVMWAAKYMGGS